MVSGNNNRQTVNLHDVSMCVLYWVGYYYYYYYYYLLQLSFHVAVVLTLVTNKNKYT